jgi:hypothetical protein
MFDSKQTLMHRLTDAVDLAIDFATLGEYGLEEPVGRTHRGTCKADPRPHVSAPAEESLSDALFPNRRRGPAQNTTQSRSSRKLSRPTKSAC